MLNSAVANLVIVSEPITRVFWKGAELIEVTRVRYHFDEDGTDVKMRVANTSNFDAAYQEMQAAGIEIKKAGV